MWIDSLNNDKISWNLIGQNRGNYSTDPDPLVILAWLCYELEEITFMGIVYLFILFCFPLFKFSGASLGYKYPEEDLVAIARLRKNTLKELAVANGDVIYSRARNINARKVRIIYY